MQNNKTKILILLGKFSSGGTERFVSHLTQRLGSDFESVIVITDPRVDYPYLGRLHRIFLPAFRRPKQYHVHIVRWWRMFIELRNLIREENPDCVIAFVPSWAFVAVLLSRNVVFALRIVPSLQFGTNAWQRWRIKFISARARAVVCNSEGSKIDIEKNYGVRNALVIYNPIDIEMIKQKSLEEPTNPIFDLWKRNRIKTFISAGRSSPQKDHALLVRAFAKLRAQRECALVIMGEGIDTDKDLRELVVSLNLRESVLLLGFQKNPFAYISRSDIFVLSSRYEGFPNTLLEAMACGLPIISTDCQSGPREILEPKPPLSSVPTGVWFAHYGILVPINDERALARAMQDVLDNAELRKSLGRAASERAEELAGSDTVHTWSKVFRGVASTLSIVTFANLGRKQNLKTSDIEPVIEEFARHGALTQVIGQLVGSYHIPGAIPATPTLIHYARRVLEKGHFIRTLSREETEERFDRFAAHRLRPVHVTLMPILFNQVLAAAKRNGSISIGLAEVAHPIFNRKINADECALLGIDEWQYPGRTKDANYITEFDNLVVMSDFAKRTYIQYGFPSERIFVAPLDVDVKRFSPKQKQQRNQPHPFTVLYSAYSTPLKGLHYLLDAWNELSLPGAKLVLVGGFLDVPDDLRRYYETKITENSSIENIGPTHTPERYYRDADIFVFPSLTEGFGRVTLEAMACGLPVITTVNARGIVEDGKTGFVIPIRDAKALAERIKYFYNNRDSVEKMGRAARLAVERKKPFGEAVYEIYQAILTNKYENYPTHE